MQSPWNAERRARGEPEIHAVYAAAGHELRPWLAAAGPTGLRSFIDRLNAGDAFEAAYRTARLGPALTPPPTRSAPARCARCG